MSKIWIGVDLDGTLAESVYGGISARKIGSPIQSMMTRVKQWVKDGKYEVRIFTARAADSTQIPMIQHWLDNNGIGGLKITCQKDGDLGVIFDSTAIRVDENTGKICDECIKHLSQQKFKYASSQKIEILRYVDNLSGLQFDKRGHALTSF